MSLSSRDSSTQHLCPEEGALCLFNDLLIHALWRVVHNDRASFVVDFGVQAGVSDQVDDPLLTFDFREAETGG